jgi:hypothetical protein
LASLKLLPTEHPIERDSPWKLARDLTTACFTPQGFSARSRATLWAWGISVLLVPREFSKDLVSWRFAPASRPELLKRSLRALKVVKHHVNEA